MEFEVKKNVARGGSFVGAIFMSNRATKDECFIRRIFGLPASQTSFVKRVKMGMMLFLFEFEERKLYGVFEASSDGAINIAPCAFNSYGKFSAQIRFKIIWHCRPLSEHEFCEAIKDNYYTHNKFHFCLSDEQVHKLLMLFYEKRKTKIRSSFSFGTGNKAMKQYQNYDVSSLRVTVMNDRVENEPHMDIDKEPVNLSRYSDSSRHYPSLSRYHKKSMLNAEGSMGEGEQRFSSTVPCSSQPLTSDSRPSTSHKDGSVTGNLHASTLRSYGFPPGQSYFSSGVDRNNCTPVKEHVYSKSPASSLFPLSRRRLYPAHKEPDALNSSSTADYLSLEVTADGDDCEALSFPDHFEPSGNDIPISGARYFDARRMCSSSFGCEGLSCSPSLSEHYDRPFLTCSPGNGTSRIRDCRHPSESQSEADYREGVSHHPPRHHDDCYANVVNYGLRSDTLNKKTSVFSRLSLQDDGIYEPRADASVDELMGLLYQRRKSWRNTRKFRPRNNDKPFESVAPMENEMSGFNAVEDDKDGDNGEAAQEICESLILNFRRRSEILKTKRGESDSRDHFEGRTQKRRKLMRPSFGKEEPFDGSAGKFLNMEALPCQNLVKEVLKKAKEQLLETLKVAMASKLTHPKMILRL
ncbi:uncharacterized protein LOC131242501 [Magnolia sinica]|uniref:uncharacterized protein LOC131242501 n=1 Tax=Magnolia sinica TaxID=86752 RepID=UPI002659FB25|nr:uncharacterized protein LOC131242501 [Magnolia sinica]XP_058097184.1 uncharacterized protein LOC131242501 [Magnolia sinica]